MSLESVADDPLEDLAVERAEEVLRSLAHHADSMYLMVGALLSRIEDERGLDRERVEAATGFRYRKARYLVSIHRAFRDLDVGADRLRGLGWAKAKEIARVPQERLARDLDALVRFALKRTRKKLIYHVNARYRIGSPPRPARAQPSNRSTRRSRSRT